MSTYTPNPDLDLVLERTVAVSPDRVFRAWTDPDLLVQWFVPAPWSCVSATLDPRPGGLFRSVMQSPEGEQFPNGGCFLEVVQDELLVFTSVLTEDYRPVVPSNGAGDLPFTARVEMTPSGDGGTHYRAVAIHADEAGRIQHEEMGFHEGWSAVLDQLVALMS